MTEPAVLDLARLHDEVIGVARDLIRLDTTNARAPGLGNETRCAGYLQDYLARNGVEAELVACNPDRANVVARIRGSSPDAESLAFVGHTDVVPCDPRDWTHPPFDAVVDDAGWLWGRGAVDMKNEVAARAVAMAELARSGFCPTGDLWLIAVADEEDGIADVGMRWLLQERTDIRPTHSVNEGGGERLPLADGREVVMYAVGEKGTLPFRITASGEAGHASQPTLGNNEVPMLARLLVRLGNGLPDPASTPVVSVLLRAVLGRVEPDLGRAVAEAGALHPTLVHVLPALMGSTLTPTMLWGSDQRNVMPARATAEVDCRILPGTTRDEVEAWVRSLLGDDIPYELTWPEPITQASSSPVDGPVPAAIAAFLAAEGDPAAVIPQLCTGFTDSNYLRAAAGTAAYGFSPFRATPTEVIDAGAHNADERVHVDDLLLSVRFHLDLARRVVG